MLRNNINNNRRRQPSQVEKYLRIMARKDETDLMSPTVPDMQPMRLKKDKVYTFSRSYSQDLSASGVGPTVSSYAFTLTQLPNYTDFTTLFDQYRILQVEFRFINTYGDGEFPGQIYSAIDYDDDNAVSITDILQYETLQITNLSRPFYRVLQPKSADIVYNGNLTVAYGQSNQPKWIDVASPGVPHYGVKLSIPTITGAPNSISLGLIAVNVVLQCRNPR